MKKIVISVVCVFLLLFIYAPSFAHPGGTDENGGHTDHSTGEYHYHHGHSAHKHYDGECLLGKNEDYINELKSRPIKQENVMAGFITFALFTIGAMYYFGTWIADKDVDFDLGTVALILFLVAVTVLCAFWTFNFSSVPYLAYILIGFVIVLPILIGFIIAKIKLK